MNNELARLDEHDTVFAELPWYANGTLPESLADQVDEHLQRCPVCQQELNLIQKTFDSVAVDDPSPEHVEQSLNQMMQRIGTYETQLDPSSTTKEQPKVGNSRGLTRIIDQFQQLLGESGPRFAAMASLAVVGIVSVVSVQLFQPSTEGKYTVLTVGESTSGQLSLRVSFREAAEPAAVIRMVQDMGISATVQTSDRQVYLVKLPGDAAFSDLNQVFARFNTDPNVTRVEAVLKPEK